jgi:hypothetical protein
MLEKARNQKRGKGMDVKYINLDMHPPSHLQLTYPMILIYSALQPFFLSLPPAPAQHLTCYPRTRATEPMKEEKKIQKAKRGQNFYWDRSGM